MLHSCSLSGLLTSPHTKWVTSRVQWQEFDFVVSRSERKRKTPLPKEGKNRTTEDWGEQAPQTVRHWSISLIAMLNFYSKRSFQENKDGKRQERCGGNQRKNCRIMEPYDMRPCGGIHPLVEISMGIKSRLDWKALAEHIFLILGQNGETSLLAGHR